MKIYNYDPVNGAFTEASEAHPSPLEEGVFLIPAYATETAPPDCGKHEVPVYADKAWTVKADFRGVTLYDTKTAKEASIEEIGVIPAEKGLTEVAPLETPCKWDDAQQQWVDDLDEIRKRKSGELGTACAKAIGAGAESSALGAAHTYPTQIPDQQNLAANVLLSLSPAAGSGWTTKQMCADAGTPPVWDYRDHTAAQIQQVSSDVNAAILALRQKNATLQAQVTAATNAAEINAITW